MVPSFVMPEEYDLVSSPVSGSWHGGLFSGNGRIGVMVYADPDRELLRLRLGNVEYIDRRPDKERTGRVSYDSPRLEIGSLYFKAPGIRKDSSLRLRLGKAEIQGRIGGKPFRLFTAREPSVIVAETDLEFAFFEPAEPVSPRYSVCRDMPSNYRKNPPPSVRKNSCTQKLLDGKSFTTCWKREKNFLFLACGFGKEGMLLLKKCSSSLVPAWRRKVSLSYRKFYGKSFLSVPDKALERFYFINLYKWHSAAVPENDFALDLMGPWPKESAWCAIWWNLNIQLTYQWLQTAGRPEEMRPLLKMLSGHLSQLEKNSGLRGGAGVGRASSYDCASPVKQEKGCLPWVCHILAEAFFHTGDKETLSLLKKLLPGVLKVYESLLYTGPDGTVHMGKTLSPEYGETQDAVFDLALFRKCVGYFLEFFRDDGKRHAEREKFRRILERLADYPEDRETGYRVGKDLAFTRSHPHANHLFMVYPLELPHKKSTALKSLRRFLAMKEEHHGFSYTSAAGMFVRYGNGNRAEKLLHTLLDWMKQRHTENFLYHENGNPVMETAFAFNGVLQDMLLLSDRERVRLFPALPGKWESASFTRFHCVNDITASASWNRKDAFLSCTLLSPGKDIRAVLELPDGSVRKVHLSAGKEKHLRFELKNNE